AWRPIARRKETIVMRHRSLAASLLLQQAGYLVGCVGVAAFFLYHAMVHRAVAEARSEAENLVTVIEEIAAEDAAIFRPEVLMPVATRVAARIVDVER